MARKKKLDTKIIHSFDKGIEVLELVANARTGISLSELAQVLKWDKSTVFRLLTTLIRRGYVDRDDETKRYHLGLRVLYLEQLLVQGLDLPRVSQGLLASLARSTGEAAHLAVLQRDRVVIAAQQESPGRVAVNAHIGTSEPLHCTALGKAILVQMPEEELRQSIAVMDFRAYTPKTIVSAEWFAKHIERVRNMGYALDEEEYDAEVRCIAVPVRIPGSRQYYALGISGPSSRVAGARMHLLIEQVIQAAAELTGQFATMAQSGKV